MIKRNFETEQYMNKFKEITGVKPLRCKLCVGSMKKYIFIEVLGTEEEYKNLIHINEGYNYKGVEITFKDFDFFGSKNKLRFHIRKEVLKWNRF